MKVDVSYSLEDIRMFLSRISIGTYVHFLGEAFMWDGDIYVNDMVDQQDIDSYQIQLSTDVDGNRTTRIATLCISKDQFLLSFNDENGCKNYDLSTYWQDMLITMHPDSFAHYFIKKAKKSLRFIKRNDPLNSHYIQQNKYLIEKCKHAMDTQKSMDNEKTMDDGLIF